MRRVCSLTRQGSVARGTLSLAFLLSGLLRAQFGTADLPDGDIGRPPAPPYITLLGILSRGTVVTDPALKPAGNVVETFYEELRAKDTPAGPAGEVVVSIRTKFDSVGRPIEERRTERNLVSLTVSRYEGPRLVARETELSRPNGPSSKSWSYWTYDASGKLTEFRRGNGADIQNHDVNFKRDEQGRVTSFEYRQGARDERFSRSEYRYSPDGRAAEIAVFFEGVSVPNRTTQIVDDRGHVISATILDRDSVTNSPRTPIVVNFRYDDKGRLVEQASVAPELQGPGVELNIPPGKIAITYDDQARTKTTSYAASDGGNSLGPCIRREGRYYFPEGGSGHRKFGVYAGMR